MVQTMNAQAEILRTYLEQLMPYQTVTLSSVGTSPPVALSWISGKHTTATVTASSSGATGDFIVQFTMQDLQRSSLPTWIGLSSNSYAITNAAATHYSIANVFPNGSSGGTGECVYLPIPGPIAGLRLSSTTISGTLNLSVIQGEGG
jgi:hypothetical protein